ncbi:MAG: hypothetical protein R2838_07830 [Caldilineaceae bacterium]
MGGSAAAFSPPAPCRSKRGLLAAGCVDRWWPRAAGGGGTLIIMGHHEVGQPRRPTTTPGRPLRDHQQHPRRVGLVQRVQRVGTGAGLSPMRSSRTA